MGVWGEVEGGEGRGGVEAQRVDREQSGVMGKCDIGCMLVCGVCDPFMLLHTLRVLR